jgi:methionyl-tRNA formyltransferase
MDAGPVCLARSEPIRRDDYGTLAGRLQELGGELLVEALDSSPPFHEQPESGVTIAPKIQPAERRLDPALDPHRLERRVRALNPHIGTYAELPAGDRLGVRRARAAADFAAPEAGALAAEGGRLFLGCAGGALELLEVQPPGGRAMDAADYVRGHAAKLGSAA